MKRIRCAIYTRKSSEEGLEQDFNSLHAQREACAAYVLSQASEGWVLSPEVYDDGGISGGTLERPALQRLLANVGQGRIDIIVVYKVDRLTRSLLDFSKLVEAFDKAGVSFVSITQSFNTTTSMGRLTLNMLLSFAQFEREVTAERIRDKIAASKAKGMWMGGTPPLGYEAAGRSLVITEPGAEIVRRIYERYLALGSVRRLAEELIRDGVCSPPRKRLSGAPFGGGWFSRGQLYSILRNPIYAGRIAHRDKVYPGLHSALIDPATWDAVQAGLTDNRQGRDYRRAAKPSVLAGLVEDENGEALIASHASKSVTGGTEGKVRYRYYVSSSVQNGEIRNIGGARIPAKELEGTVAAAIAAALADPIGLSTKLDVPLDAAMLSRLSGAGAALADKIRAKDPDSLRTLVTRVRVSRSEIRIDLGVQALATLLGCDAPQLPVISLVVPVRLTRTGRAMQLVQADGQRAGGGEPNSRLIKLILRGRSFWERLATGSTNVAAIAREESLTPSYVTRLTRLAFLSPKVIEAIVTGCHPASLDAGALVATGLAPSWKEQEARFLGS